MVILFADNNIDMPPLPHERFLKEGHNYNTLIQQAFSKPDLETTFDTKLTGLKEIVSWKVIQTRTQCQTKTDLYSLLEFPSSYKLHKLSTFGDTSGESVFPPAVIMMMS